MCFYGIQVKSHIARTRWVWLNQWDISSVTMVPKQNLFNMFLFWMSSNRCLTKMMFGSVSKDTIIGQLLLQRGQIQFLKIIPMDQYSKNIDYFRGDPNLIRIHLYTDELEVVNPLGSKKLLHKVCAFYFSIGYLEPKYRSHLRHIHLAILARYQLVQKYTYSDILKPLIEDLNKLQTTGLYVCDCG